jgi:hypothetical protein
MSGCTDFAKVKVSLFFQRQTVFRQIFQLHTQGVDLVPSGRRNGWSGIPSYRKISSRQYSAQVVRLSMISNIVEGSPRPLPLLLAGTPALAPTGVFPRPGATRAGALAGGWFTICPPLPRTNPDQDSLGQFMSCVRLDGYIRQIQVGVRMRLTLGQPHRILSRPSWHPRTS